MIRRLGIVAILAISAIGFVLLTAAEAPAVIGSPVADSSSVDFLRPTSEDGGAGRIHYDIGQGPVSIGNHAVVPLGNDLQIEVAVTPYPPTTFDVALDIYLTEVSGAPVRDADVTAVWDMVVMWHGPFETVFANKGDGHYTASFDLFMFGPWNLDINVFAPGSPADQAVTLSIYVWPD